MISKILSVDKAFGGSKKRKHTKFGVLSIGVDSTDIDRTRKIGIH